MKLYMDNVPTLAIQAPILRNMHSILNPSSINRMSADIIAEIAGETKEKTLEREEIVGLLATLENGARICRQYAMRPRSGKSKSVFLESRH